MNIADGILHRAISAIQTRKELYYYINIRWRKPL
ncbi:hypothetical protein T11_16839 [Trichinella zimbabwensis]|uniref:Uncharacterized protein n=1 Tax=Trichinella zimbabwensis TaxID=268475 RepID=A0A0V1G6Q4_9BILA|nr:hypothetical protein T11_16839 [Trichinella zimbabwensis]